MRQNIGFFDRLGAGEITTRITADTNLIQDGISEKVGLTLTALATFITAFVIGFIKVSSVQYFEIDALLTDYSHGSSLSYLPRQSSPLLLSWGLVPPL